MRGWNLGAELTSHVNYHHTHIPEASNRIATRAQLELAEESNLGVAICTLAITVELSSESTIDEHASQAHTEKIEEESVEQIHAPQY